MSRTVRIIVGIVIVGVVGGSIALAYLWFSGGSGAPSAPLTAATLVIATRQPTAEATEAAAATAEMTAEATAAAAAAVSAAQSDPVVFDIVSDQSQVSFTLTEELRGQPTTVVGTTNQVAGQIGVDFSNPQASQIGEIRIDARTLTTPEEMRNRTIRGQILQSAQDKYEFISFKPTAVTGLPDTITMGEAFTFQITGDLTIRDITQSVTFDATVTPVSATQLEGTATTTVQRGDFGLNIPNVPQVANVSEAVQLAINFVATPAAV